MNRTLTLTVLNVALVLAPGCAEVSEGELSQQRAALTDVKIADAKSQVEDENLNPPIDEVMEPPAVLAPGDAGYTLRENGLVAWENPTGSDWRAVTEDWTFPVCRVGQGNYYCVEEDTDVTIEVWGGGGGGGRAADDDQNIHTSGWTTGHGPGGGGGGGSGGYSSVSYHIPIGATRFFGRSTVPTNATVFSTTANVQTASGPLPLSSAYRGQSGGDATATSGGPGGATTGAFGTFSANTALVFAHSGANGQPGLVGHAGELCTAGAGGNGAPANHGFGAGGVGGTGMYGWATNCTDPPPAGGWWSLVVAPARASVGHVRITYATPYLLAGVHGQVAKGSPGHLDIPVSAVSTSTSPGYGTAVTAFICGGGGGGQGGRHSFPNGGQYLGGTGGMGGSAGGCAEMKYQLPPDGSVTTLSIDVGAGGIGGPGYFMPGTDGGSSRFFADATHNVTVRGGARGASLFPAGTFYGGGSYLAAASSWVLAAWERAVDKFDGEQGAWGAMVKTCNGGGGGRGGAATHGYGFGGDGGHGGDFRAWNKCQFYKTDEHMTPGGNGGDGYAVVVW